MKKIIIVELAVLALLLVAVVVFAITGISQPTFAPGHTEPSDATGQTESTGLPPEATPGETEPPVTEVLPTWPTYPNTRQLLAKQYFVYDCKAEKFLILSGTADERIWPASVTKLFTAYVAMQYLQPGTEITAGSELDMVVWGSSVANIQKGDKLTVKQLVEAMMLPSGNDAAYVLAAAAGREMEGNAQLGARAAVDAFMKKMNELAKSLGMTGTNFVNPDGIHDDKHYMSARDLAALGKLSMENATIMEYAATAREQVTLHGETVEWKNTNALIDPTTPYYCPYAVGLKTGQTPSAGSCLLSAFVYEDRELIIGVFGCPEVDDRFEDTLQLFNKIVLN